MDEVLTLEMLEEESIKENKSHFFEDNLNAINFLMESIELDSKLLDLGVFKEAEGEEESSDDDEDFFIDEDEEESSEDTKSNKDEDMNVINLKISEKIKLVLGKIAAGFVALAAKIVNFIKTKINEFQRNNIVKAFKSGNIDVEKMTEKLNKTQLFDPEKTYELYARNGAFGHYLGYFMGPITAPAFTNNKLIDEYHAKVQEISTNAVDPKELGTLFTDKEGNTADLLIKINPENAQTELVKLYEDTVKYLEKVEEDQVKVLAKDVKDKEASAKDIKDKEKLKSAKGALAVVKACYQSALRVSKYYVSQVNTLQAIITAFAMHNGEDTNNNNEEENK